MKKIVYFLVAIIIAFPSRAQAPEKISFQAVIRDNTDVLLSNTAIGIKISILQGSASGTPVFIETQTISTNDNGLATLEIGGGTPVLGSLGSINWASGSYYIKTETDPSGGSNYTISGTSQLMSVPYALYAANSGITPSGNHPGEMLYWTGVEWALIGNGIDGQVLTFCSGLPAWTWGGICREDTIGDTGPGGGLIFYDKGYYSDGWRYLEASPTDLAPSAWGCRDISIPGTSYNVGTGEANTNLIIAYCSTIDIAARKCNDYSNNGYNDWFLPSAYELFYMWQNLDLQSLGGFSDGPYWSSTQFIESQAWSVDFFHGDQHDLDKSNFYYVRPIRKF